MCHLFGPLLLWLFPWFYSKFKQPYLLHTNSIWGDVCVVGNILLSSTYWWYFREHLRLFNFGILWILLDLYEHFGSSWIIEWSSSQNNLNWRGVSIHQRNTSWKIPWTKWLHYSFLPPLLAYGSGRSMVVGWRCVPFLRSPSSSQHYVHHSHS